MKSPVTTALLLFAMALLTLEGCDKASSPTPDGTAQPVPVRRVYAVLGSSTAQGVGPAVHDSSWVRRCVAYLPTTITYRRDSIINLARAGFTSADILPSGDASRNISRALSYHPYAIIVNMPTNDIANGGSVDDQMKNFALIAELAKQQHVELWFTTSQPRNLTKEGRKKLMELKDRINTAYGEHAIDFWTDAATSEGSIKPALDAGDGIHLSSGAHRLLFLRVVKKVFPR